MKAASTSNSRKKFRVTDDFLIDVWTSGLLNDLVDPKGDSSEDVLRRAKVGYPVWSNDFFSDSKPSSSDDSTRSGSQGNIDRDNASGTLMTSSYCGDKVPTGLSIAVPESTTFSGEICDDHYPPTNSQIPVLGQAQASTMWGLDSFSEKRKRRCTQESKRMSAQELAIELLSPSINQHLLVSPHVYGESHGAGQNKKQAFQIKVHPQVGMISDVHAHLCDAEVIGLLAGKYDAQERILYVQFPFPCVSTVRSEDDGSTDVELDPVSEIAVREAIESMGLQVVGWYHSHPKFRPDPSVIDIHNQAQNQEIILNSAEFKASQASRGGSSNNNKHSASGSYIPSGSDESTVGGIEEAPFVGLIVSSWDQSSANICATHRWFHVTEYAVGEKWGNRQKIVHIPLLLDVIYRYSKFPADADTAAMWSKDGKGEPTRDLSLATGATGSVAKSDSNSSNNSDTVDVKSSDSCMAAGGLSGLGHNDSDSAIAEYANAAALDSESVSIRDAETVAKTNALFHLTGAGGEDYVSKSNGGGDDDDGDGINAVNSFLIGSIPAAQPTLPTDERQPTEDEDKKSSGCNSESVFPYQSNMCSEDSDLTHVATVALDTDSENEVSSDHRSFKQVNVKVCPPDQVSSPSKPQRMPSEYDFSQEEMRVHDMEAKYHGHSQSYAELQATADSYFGHETGPKGTHKLKDNLYPLTSTAITTNVPSRRFSSRAPAPVVKFEAYSVPDRKVLQLRGSLPNSQSYVNGSYKHALERSDVSVGKENKSRKRAKKEKSEAADYEMSEMESTDNIDETLERRKERRQTKRKARKRSDRKQRDKDTASVNVEDGADIRVVCKTVLKNATRKASGDSQGKRRNERKDGSVRKVTKREDAMLVSGSDKSIDMPSRGKKTKINTASPSSASAKQSRRTATVKVKASVGRKVGIPSGSNTSSATTTSTTTAATAAAAAVTTASSAKSETSSGAPSASTSSRKRSSQSLESKPLSLTAALSSDFPESRIAKTFFLGLPRALHHMQGVVLVLISMGFYYGRHKRRVHLDKRSKFHITKNEKMVQSASVWLDAFGITKRDKEELRTRIAELFLVCWS